MLNQVQHDMRVRFWPFCHPELVSGSQFWVLDSYMFKPENLSLTLENKWCHAELGSLMKTPCQVRNSIKHLFQKKE